MGKPDIIGSTLVIKDEQLNLKCASIWGQQFTSYKWFFNGVAINGAVNEQYQKSSFSRAHTGNYSCEILNNDLNLTKTSDNVTVLVLCKCNVSESWRFV